MNTTAITSDFWYERLEVNAQRAIFHQWEQLLASGCIENFRIAAGETEGWREGWFFADSDAYKWLEAAARIQAAQPDPRLGERIDELIALIGRAQMADGYIFTYNQIHFPGTRWHNLQIEHELYCHGHLIEAGVTHYETCGRTDLLEIARKAAERIAADFRGKGPADTPGHEEIEIALLRLAEVTQDEAYYQMARQFVEQRGRAPLFGLQILRQNIDADRRKALIRAQKQAYLEAHPGFKPFQIPPDNAAVLPRFAGLRRVLSGLSGQYLQQHVPVRHMTAPVGHAVRFGYFETAAAMLARRDRSLLPALEQCWERMVTRRMYVTGGLGSQPSLEGFGSDDDLDPEVAYAETCAALASLYWSWEMGRNTGAAKYSELFEWQLYNAAAVGMGLDGSSYLYNNPLTCRGGIQRRAWYAVPCCPSNISRTWANLGKYILSDGPQGLAVHQYISSRARLEGGELEIQSGLPWNGDVGLKYRGPGGNIRLRQPGWASEMRVYRAGQTVLTEPGAVEQPGSTAGGYDPRAGRWVTVACQGPQDELKIELDMPVRLRRAGAGVKGHDGKAAVTRGPLVFCLEDRDNPGIDIFETRLDPASLTTVFDPDLLGGTIKILGQTLEGQALVFIPYFLWGNRGPARMTVWIKA